MSVMQIPDARTRADLTAKIAIAAYVGAKLHLYKNDFTPSHLSVLADFIEADFGGYAAAVVTWSAVFLDQNGVPVSTIGEILFAMTGAPTNLVYGCYLTDAAGTGLLWSTRFDTTPVNFAVAPDALPVTAQMSLANGTVLQSVGP